MGRGMREPSGAGAGIVLNLDLGDGYVCLYTHINSLSRTFRICALYHIHVTLKEKKKMKVRNDLPNGSSATHPPPTHTPCCSSERKVLSVNQPRGYCRDYSGSQVPAVLRISSLILQRSLWLAPGPSIQFCSCPQHLGCSGWRGETALEHSSQKALGPITKPPLGTSTHIGRGQGPRLSSWRHFCWCFLHHFLPAAKSWLWLYDHSLPLGAPHFASLAS